MKNEAENQNENVLSLAEKLKEKGFINKVFVLCLCLGFYVFGGYSWPYVKALGVVLKMAQQAVNEQVEADPDPGENDRDDPLASVSKDCPKFSPVQLYIKKP